MKKRAAAVALTICLIGRASVGSLAKAPASDGNRVSVREMTCGGLALLIMAKLEGVPARPRAILSALPEAHHDGHSMREIQDAARARGLNLAGVRVPTGAQIDRPLLVYLQQENHGHYVIVRPVGRTGKLVQLIDATRGCSIVDLDRLYASSEWTGKALAPYRSTWGLGQSVGLFVLAAVPVMFWSARRSLTLGKLRARTAL